MWVRCRDKFAGKTHARERRRHTALTNIVCLSVFVSESVRLVVQYVYRIFELLCQWAHVRSVSRPRAQAANVSVHLSTALRPGAGACLREYPLRKQWCCRRIHMYVVARKKCTVLDVRPAALRGSSRRPGRGFVISPTVLSKHTHTTLSCRRRLFVESAPAMLSTSSSQTEHHPHRAI